MTLLIAHDLEKNMDLLQHSARHLRSIYAGGSILMKADENTASRGEAVAFVYYM